MTESDKQNTAFKLMVAKAKPMKKRKSDNRLRISSFCMHTQAHKLNKKKTMGWKDSQEPKCEMRNGWCRGFDFILRPFSLCCVISFHFFFRFIFVSHSKSYLS